MSTENDDLVGSGARVATMSMLGRCRPEVSTKSRNQPPSAVVLPYTSGRSHSGLTLADLSGSPRQNPPKGRPAVWDPEEHADEAVDASKPDAVPASSEVAAAPESDDFEEFGYRRSDGWRAEQTLERFGEPLGRHTLSCSAIGGRTADHRSRPLSSSLPLVESAPRRLPLVESAHRSPNRCSRRRSPRPACQHRSPRLRPYETIQSPRPHTPSPPSVRGGLWRCSRSSRSQQAPGSRGWSLPQWPTTRRTPSPALLIPRRQRPPCQP